MKLRPKLLRIPITVAGLLILLLAGIHTPPVRTYALGKLSGYLRSAAGIDMAAESFRFNLLALSAEFKGLTLRSAEPPNPPPFLTAASVEAGISFFSLFTGRPVVDRALLRDLRVQIKTDSRGNDNLPHPPFSGEEAESERILFLQTPVLIEDLKVRPGSFRYVDQTQNLELELPQWRLEITGDPAGRSQSLRFETEQAGRVEFKTHLLPVDELKLGVELAPGRLKLTEFSLEFGESRIKADGRVDGFDSPEVESTAAADLDLGKLLGFFGPARDAGGHLAIEASVSGPAAGMKVSSRIRGENIFYRDIHDVDVAVSARWREDGGSIEIDSLEIVSPHGSVSGKASLGFLTELGRNAASLRLDDLDLGIVTGYLLPIRIASRADGNVEMEWSGTAFAQADAKAELRLRASRSGPSRYVLPFTGTVSAATSGGNLESRIDSGRVLHMGVEGRFSLASWEKAGGRLRAKTESMADFIRELEAFLGRDPGTLIGLPLDGPLNADAQFDTTPAGIRISGNAEAPDTTFGDFRKIDVKANVAYSPERLVLEDFRAVWENQEVAAGGKIEFGEEGTRLDLEAKIENGMLGAVSAGLGKDWPIGGGYVLEARLGGTAGDIDLSASASVTELHAYGQNLGRMEIAAAMRRDRIGLERFELIQDDQEESEGRWTASGWYDRGTGEYTFRTGADGIRLDFGDKVLPGVPAFSGRLDFAASGDGSADDPSMDAELELNDLKAGGRTLGQLVLEGRLKREKADVEIRAPGYNLGANAGVGIRAPYPAQFEAEIDSGLSAFDILVSEKEKLDGRIRAEIRGSGDLARWRDGSVFFRAEDLEASLRGIHIQNRGPVVLRYEKGRLDSRSMNLEAGNSAVSLNGSLPLDSGPTSENMKVEGLIDLSEMSRWLEIEGMDASGTLRLEGTIQGTLRRPEPSLNFSMSGGRFDHTALRTSLESIDLDATLAPDAVVVRSLSAELGPAHLRVSGGIPMSAIAGNSRPGAGGKSAPANFKADFTDLQIGDFSAVPRSVTGSAGFHLEAATPDIRDLRKIEARATFDRLRIGASDYMLEQDKPVRLILENGILTLDHFSLTSPTTTLQAAGSIGLTGEQDLDVRVDGDFNIGTVTLLTRDVSAEGDSRFELQLKGSLKNPNASGFFEMKQGKFSIPSVSATGLRVRINIKGQSLDIDTFTGNLNGGDLEIDGTAGFGTSGIRDAAVEISLENAFFNYPDGLRYRLSGDLTLRSLDEFLVLGGNVRILEGSYRRQLNVVEQLLGRLQSDRSVQFTGEENPFLSRLRFDLNVETLRGLLIDNNLAELTVDADVRLTGGYYSTGLVGRVNLEEGGRLRFHERTYRIERGIISLTDQTRIEPRLDIQAATRVGSYDITLTLTGTMGDLKADLTSDPPLSQPDIVALLLTGRQLEDLQGSGLNVAREQVESYLSGQLATFLSQNVEEALGLSLVRIDPSLISPEANPGARLTVGDDITDSLFLIYSMNLVDAGDRILSVEYDITRNFLTELTRQSDNSYRFSLGQDFRFGGLPKPSDAGETIEKHIGNIEFTGHPVFTRERLLDRVGVNTGDAYDFFEISKGLDRLRKFYRDRDYLENRIRFEKSDFRDKADLTVQIEAGPVVEFVYRGWDPPGGTKDKIRSAWSEGIFQAQRIQSAERELRRPLAGEGYLQAEIQSAVDAPLPDRKTVTFTIDPGIRFAAVETEFGGAFGIPPSRLKTVLENENLMDKIRTEPENVTDFIGKYYRQHGYLDVAVKEPEYRLNPKRKTGMIVIPIREGPKFRIREINLQGNAALTDSRILTETGLTPEDEYNPEKLKNSVDSLEKLYWTLGYNNVRLGYDLKRSEEGNGALDIVLKITENRQQFVREIVVEGNRETAESMIRSQITLKPGEILDYAKANESRNNLYDTKAFTLVDVQSLPYSGPQLPEEAGRQPVQIKVKVTEAEPFRLKYNGFYDTERGAGGIVDFSNRNSLGSARLLGARVRYDSDVEEVRGYFSQPILRRFPIQTDITAYLRKENVSSEESPNFGFDTDTVGVSLQQEVQFRHRFILNYGYRFEHKRELDFGRDPPVETIQDTAPLTVALTRESRDNLLDSWKGSFASLAFEYAPSYLGSDLRYYKFLGQYFHYLPLSAPTKVPWVGETRSRLVFAGGARVGFAAGLDGQELISSNKFFAGGGTTIRGFGQNEVGPKGPDGNPIGGNAIFMINGELRFPIFSIFDGTGFLDVGNVYPDAGDFDPTDIRASAGFGLRARTPYFLLRADYGVKLDREPGEPAGKFFFSIGQAF
ncbi:MAG: translocation/assembly module TamB domain-containing protein [Acidobacteria bacterium]|nr:translocation/assembly module TamB domain-containing protein [Acidobacteriota bacterium]